MKKCGTLQIRASESPNTASNTRRDTDLSSSLDISIDATLLNGSGVLACTKTASHAISDKPSEDSEETMNCKGETFAMNALPKELSYKIMSYLAPEDLASSSRVCKSWRQISGSNLLWRPHLNGLARDRALDFSRHSCLQDVYNTVRNYEKRLKAKEENLKRYKQEQDMSTRQYTPHWNNYEHSANVSINQGNSWAKLQEKFAQLSPRSVVQERENLITPADLVSAGLVSGPSSSNRSHLPGTGNNTSTSDDTTLNINNTSILPATIHVSPTQQTRRGKPLGELTNGMISHSMPRDATAPYRVNANANVAGLSIAASLFAADRAERTPFNANANNRSINASSTNYSRINTSHMRNRSTSASGINSSRWNDSSIDNGSVSALYNSSGHGNTSRLDTEAHSRSYHASTADSALGMSGFMDSSSLSLNDSGYVLPSQKESSIASRKVRYLGAAPLCGRQEQEPLMAPSPDKLKKQLTTVQIGSKKSKRQLKRL